MGGYVNRTKIAQLYADAESLGGQTVTVAGWVKSVRDMKNFGFVTLNDGSCFRDLQVAEAAAVVERNKAKVLHVADGLDPAGDGDGLAAERLGIGIELRDFGAVHVSSHNG